MKISQLLPVVCVLAATANFSAVRADDTPAQAAARSALEQKLSQLGETPPASANNVPSTAPQTADDNVTMTTVNSKDAKAEAKARKAAAAAKAKQDAADLKAKKEADKKMAAQRASEAKMASHPMTTSATPVPQNDSSQRAAQRAALAAADGNMQPSQNGDHAANYAGKDFGMQPLSAPPLPISATKEARLQTLLGQYKANTISPEEYHKQREAILAEP